jgi:DNA-binding CsgD family transcriptional regulator
MSQARAGAGTRDVARHMFVSENTVQDHLKSILTKTATRSRRALLARARHPTTGAAALT